MSINKVRECRKLAGFLVLYYCDGISLFTSNTIYLHRRVYRHITVADLMGHKRGEHYMLPLRGYYTTENVSPNIPDVILNRSTTMWMCSIIYRCLTKPMTHEDGRLIKRVLCNITYSWMLMASGFLNTDLDRNK